MSTLLPHGNCYRVNPQFIAGEYPASPDQATTAEKLGRHLDAGITAFLDLTEAGELRSYAADLAALATHHGIAALHRRHPIRDLNVPATPAHMVAILDELDTAIGAGHTVYVHCWGGIGRTGTVVGCWLVRHGLTG
ncbi:MAG TPA: protein-tyrosine phosphatase family protein, partial [Roseiflexaceae bacterium]|nr:protein-tyrosine phosphatase family protein [Roseiflexaceae bacterium]